MSMNKILIVGSTHGHERIGLSVIDVLKELPIQDGVLDFEIGNPKASQANIAFIEQDLNRIFPGKPEGTYEEMRANELFHKIKNYDIVIDIHSTNTTDLSPDSMLIVTKYDQATRELIDVINPPRVLVMNYGDGIFLTSSAKVGIAFEYGIDTSKDVLDATVYDIAQILLHLGMITNNPYATKKEMQKTEVYEVYNIFRKEFEGGYTLNPKLVNLEVFDAKNWVCTTDQGETITTDHDFIPILFGENRYTTMLGFMARRLQ